MRAQSDQLEPWQRWFVALFGVVLLGFGVLVELRSAFLKQRLGDFRVFAQAAWAVRASSAETAFWLIGLKVRAASSA